VPWHVAESGKCPASRPWAVIKDSDSSIEGCHTSKTKANRQMAALYAKERSNRMATEDTPAAESEHSPENMEAGEFVYRASDPELMHFREAEEGGSPVLEGVMMPYNEWTEVNSSIEGHFMERFAPGSLAKTLRERASRIRALFEHGLDFLGRQPIATIDEFRDEEDGAYYEASLLRGLPDLLVEGLRRGVYGSSIRYRPVPGKWDRVRNPGSSEHNPDGLPEYTVREAFVKEFSVVTFPQYEGATARIRSLTDEFSVGRLLKDPERLIEVIRAVTVSEPQHSEPTKPADEPDEADSEESRSTPTHDYLSTEKGVKPWRL
jgi:HK97 family phage prohead protease